jgi:hypothetical protein
VKRRVAPPDPTVPEWVQTFELDRWATDRPPPAWWTDSLGFWRYFEARRLWMGACQDWARDHPGVDLFALHYPETAANLREARDHG